MSRICGVYRINHSSGQFYIGGSINVVSRFAAHMSNLKYGNRENKGLQRLWDDSGREGFALEVLERCEETKLDQLEESYLKRFVNVDPLCVNTVTDVRRTALGVKRVGKNENILRAISILGKNLKDGSKPRPLAVTFVSPRGREYPKVINVSGFARTHGLSQSLLNNIARGIGNHHKGWSLKGTDKELFKIQEGESTRIWIFVAPDGSEHPTTTPVRFGSDRGMTRHMVSRMKKGDGASRKLPGDGTGRVWHLKGSIRLYNFRNVQTGELVKGIGAPAVFAKSRGINPITMRRLVSGEVEKTHCGWTVIN